MAQLAHLTDLRDVFFFFKKGALLAHIRSLEASILNFQGFAFQAFNGG